MREDELLYPKYRLLGRLTQAAAHLFSGSDLRDRSAAETYGSIVGLLEPQQRDSLVVAAIGIVNEIRKADAIAELGAGVAHLSVPWRDSLVATAIGIGDDIAKAKAIAALSARMAHLSRPQRERLVAAAIGFGSDSDKAKTIAALGAGAAHPSATASSPPRSASPMIPTRPARSPGWARERLI